MSGWSRTVKPSADTTKDAADIYGVDRAEVAAQPGLVQPGWSHRKVVGTRVLWETLVAMKQAPDEDDADDTVLPDVSFVWSTPPQTIRTVVHSDPTTYGAVIVVTVPVVGITGYQWQVQTGGVGAWASATGGVYSNDTTDTLTISNTAGLGTNNYRVVASTATSGSQASPAGSLTTTAPVISISVQPAPDSVTAPAAASFAVTSSITGAASTMTYQWQEDVGGIGTWANLANAGVYSTVTTATLNISNSTGLNTNEYRVVINGTGSAVPVTSNSALLTVA